MDPLDLILLEAWNRVSKRVREKRILALQRSQRRFKGILTRPMREWCLVVRASDTRIHSDFGASVDEPAVAEHRPHTVILSGTAIRELTKPVTIPWPGVTYHEAARRCGREYKTIKNWVRQGVFNVEHYREFRFPEFTKRSKGGLATKNFGGRPYVWTPSPLDVNNFEGRTPHRVWGTLWQWLWEKMPENYELVVRREPCLWMYPGRDELQFRGWNFICPGRLDEHGEYKGCGRRCRYLYGPQTVWTLGKAMCTGRTEDEAEDGFDMPSAEESGLTGQWFPGLGDPIKSAAGDRRSFACKTCWGVRSACMANYRGWNEFVAQISGGLLYGRDVPRPADICPVERKKRPYKWRKTHPCAGRGRKGPQVMSENDLSMPQRALGSSG